MDNKIRLVGFSGSLRQNSHNSAALRAAQELLPANVELEIVSLADLPFYNEDVEQAGLPEAVRQFAASLEQADAWLIASPEYNAMIPGVLKNALDWISRQPTRHLLKERLVGLIGASAGPGGGVRAQQQLAHLLKILGAQPHAETEVLIGRSFEKFDNAGQLTDPAARQQLATLLETLTGDVSNQRQQSDEVQLEQVA